MTVPALDVLREVVEDVYGAGSPVAAEEWAALTDLDAFVQAVRAAIPRFPEGTVGWRYWKPVYDAEARVKGETP